MNTNGEHAVAAALPPGPGLLATVDFVCNPFRFLDRCAARYGEWFTMRVPGVPSFVFTSDPAAIREIFLGNPELMHAGEANRPLGAFMGGRSVLFLDGAEHLDRRRLLLPAFSGERMNSYAGTMCEAADRVIDRWPLGRPFAVHPHLREITFDVIIRTVFGMDDGATESRLRTLLSRLFDLYASPAGTLFALRAMRIDLGAWSPWGRALRLQREIDSILFDEFARRRRDGIGARTDILSILLAARDGAGAPIADEALRDEMMTLVLAGHETTAATMSWIVNQLLMHRDAMERATSEVCSVLAGAPAGAAHVGRLKFLDAVISETMRLNPVIPNAARVLKAPMMIAGRALPAGVAVAPCIYLAHRRADLWPEPEKFNPDRFLDARPSPYAFFPFGGGTHRCLGAAFATYQMKIVIAEILARVELKPVEGYVARTLRRGIAFAPSDGLPVIVSSRRS